MTNLDLSSPPGEDHFQRLIRLLEIEAEAEKQQMLHDLRRRSPAEAELSGNSILSLIIREEDAGLGGRILLTFGKHGNHVNLPWTRLGVGTPVLLSEENNSGAADFSVQGWRGVVSSLDKESIQVAFATWPETTAERPNFRLDHASDEISRKRQQQALEKARLIGGGRLAVLKEVLLGQQPPVFAPPSLYEPLDLSLNKTQQQAVQFAMSAEDLAIIHGPPGTGKTTTLVELIRQIVRLGQTVLAVAPSNLAVDNMLERLLAAGENAVRLGHPARVQPELRDHTLDLMVENHPDVRLAHKLARDAYRLREQASKWTRATPERGARQAMRMEAKQMLAEARQIEDQLVERLLDKAQILCATNTGLERDLLGKRIYDWCIMDESSQSTEAAAWIPILFANRLVLAGDPRQLPPTVVSPEALADGFNISLMERLMEMPGPDISRRLTVQYRMHQDIMEFSSREFYEHDLIADLSVRRALLQELPGVAGNDLTSTPVHFIDTAGASYDEVVEPDGESRLNPQEADLVLRKVQALLDSGLSAKDIAVITPYSAQVRLLRQLFKSTDVEIDSVDGFQGREKQAVIVSLVRSNRDNDIGFLEDVRRMNVALTRARRKLIVIGDSATITIHPFYQRLVKYFESIGAYHSVWEEY
ncbi:MAG: AAA domain-containing protein [Anaerolineaceae bacterium]|nr:AAA domain-containing protein [Anaerolineaceae bacterium]